MALTKSYQLRHGRMVVNLEDVRINGRTLVSAVELSGAGVTQLSFVAEITPDQKTIIGGFKSLSGMDSETEIVEMHGQIPASRHALRNFKLVSETAAVAKMPGMKKFSNVTLKRG